MKKLNPLIFFNLLIFLFAILGLFIIYSLIKLDINYWGIVIVGIITIFLFFLIYTINFGIPTSNKINIEIEKRKKSLVYTNEYFEINNPLLERKKIIYWKTIEAIFLLNKPPLDGEYHNFQYIIILNTEPEDVKYNIQKWYNIFNLSNFFPKRISKDLPIININDDSNKDFNTFSSSINKYLKNINKKTPDYLGRKFGNENKEIKLNNNITTSISNPLKTIGFYQIFDLGNDLKDKRLIEYREEVKKNKYD